MYPAGDDDGNDGDDDDDDDDDCVPTTMDATADKTGATAEPQNMLLYVALDSDKSYILESNIFKFKKDLLGPNRTANCFNSAVT